MRLLTVERAAGEAVAEGRAWVSLLPPLLLFPPSVLLYLNELRGGARLPSAGGACKNQARKFAATMRTLRQLMLWEFTSK